MSHSANSSRAITFAQRASIERIVQALAVQAFGTYHCSAVSPRPSVRETQRSARIHSSGSVSRSVMRPSGSAFLSP